ncbi:MAG: FlgD immunoglobulin-like domain containing protein, partial [Calditrichia bacterium]
TQSQIDEVRAQYGTDWEEWPVDMGAPFYDLNGNGIYEPEQGETPGIAAADQVIWFVCNDLDQERTNALYGSPPIGIELQVTVWGFKQEGALGQSSFRRYRMINKSGCLFDSIYIAQWSDPDVGYPGDDYAGCDPQANMGYAYNGFFADESYTPFNLAPPAIGYDLLQGPLVPSSGDTAIFNFKRRPGYRNLPMTSFAYLAAGTALTYPPLRDYEGTIEWYKMLRGFVPNNADPNDLVRYKVGAGPEKGEPTLFPLSGDPYAMVGDLDGREDNFTRGDRSIALSSGPFTMQPGDTQEVVVGIVGGILHDNLTSVRQMKENDRVARAGYYNSFKFLPSPLNFAAVPEYRSESQTRIHFTAVNKDAEWIQLFIRKYDDALAALLPLYDDGQHGDGSAGDGVFGIDWNTAPLSEGLYVDAQVYYSGGNSYTWQRIQENLTTAGPVKVSRFILGADNLNHDGIANPGENIRYTLEVQNQSAFNFSQLLVRQMELPGSQAVRNFYAPNGNEVIPSLTANSKFSWDYSPGNPFYQFDINNNFTGNDSIYVAIQISNDRHNLWKDTVAVWVAPFPTEPRDRLMTKTAGGCFGQLGYRLVDPSLLNGHSYRITFDDTLPDGSAFYTLLDLTAGSTLLTNQPYPDQYGHNSQVVQGFLVTRGTTIPTDSVGGWDWVSTGERWLAGVDAGLSTFGGGFGLGKEFFGSTLSDDQYHSVKIVFDSTMRTNCAVYRRDLGYRYSGIGTFNGAAYDISDTLNPRRVNIVFSETDTPEKPANMTWDPDAVTSYGGIEYFFIMNSDYDPATAGGYDDTNSGPTADVVWAGWTAILGGHTFLETPAEFYLKLNKKIKPGCVFEFTPHWTGIASTETVPLAFQLYQNYPNPFNPVTNVRFSLSRLVKVRLDIYNVLGQRVRTLVDREMAAGAYRLQWDGRNDAGNYLGSGIYFYRIWAGDYVKTRKMILMR